MTADAARAIVEWHTILGPDGLDASESGRARYARTTAPRGTRPCAVLYPSSTDEVQEIVRIAARHGVVVYPVSRGRNWGYGDACAPTEAAAIVDLGRMNRVVEINATLGYAVVEPGVTQRQLFDAVHRDAPDFWLDCSAAGPEGSVVGNALDRGFGHTPYGDHVRTTCGLEVVLPDGRLVRTGFGHFEGARTAHAYPYGVGPILDGLFMQSNLGIVTRMGVWLYPKPEAFCFFHVGVKEESQVGVLVDALRPLRMKGLLNSAVHIGNDLRVLSSMVPYPWDACGGKPPLGRDTRHKLRTSAGLGAWNVSGSLAGPAAQVRAASRALRGAMRGIGKVTFVGDRKLRWGRRAVNALQRVGLGGVPARQLEALEPNYGLLKGEPAVAPLAGAHWRVRDMGAPKPVDPLDTHAGLLWMSPVLPLNGGDVHRLLDAVEPLFHDEGFDLLATFTMLNERAMVGILNLAFDQRLEEEAAAADRCYKAVLAQVLALGYPPYRTAPCGMPQLRVEGDTFWELTRDIKRALDPKDILARGRYVPPLDGD